MSLIALLAVVAGYAVVVINLTTGQVYAPITVGGYPTAVAITA
jgi:hypothetical protein